MIKKIQTTIENTLGIDGVFTTMFDEIIVYEKDNINVSIIPMDFNEIEVQVDVQGRKKLDDHLIFICDEWDEYYLADLADHIYLQQTGVRRITIPD